MESKESVLTADEIIQALMEAPIHLKLLLTWFLFATCFPFVRSYIAKVEAEKKEKKHV